MNPTVTQQLRSLRLRFAETIMPALPPDAGFAQEQAQLMLATMDWLLDTHEHQYRYEVVENADYRRLLAELADAAPGTADDALLGEVGSGLSAPGPAPSEAVLPLSDLIDQNRRLKQLAMQLASVLLAVPDGVAAGRARSALVDIACRQGDRELAFYRMTGFPQQPDELGALLGGDSSTSTA